MVLLLKQMWYTLSHWGLPLIPWFFQYGGNWLSVHIFYFPQDLFFLVPWTPVCSGSSCDLKTDLLEWCRLNSPSLCLKIWGFDRCRKRDYQWQMRNNNKKCFSTLNFSMAFFNSSLVLFIVGSTSSFSEQRIYKSSSSQSSYSLPNSAPAVP